MRKILIMGAVVVVVVVAAIGLAVRHVGDNSARVCRVDDVSGSCTTEVDPDDPSRTFCRSYEALTMRARVADPALHWTIIPETAPTRELADDARAVAFTLSLEDAEQFDRDVAALPQCQEEES